MGKGAGVGCGEQAPEFKGKPETSAEAPAQKKLNGLTWAGHRIILIEPSDGNWSNCQDV